MNRIAARVDEAAAAGRGFSRPAPTLTAVAIGLALVYVIWGSTAPAIRVAVRTLPPFSMVALRFGCAGALLWTWCRVRGVPMPRAIEWRGAAVTGLALLVASNGVFAWTEQYIPSGIASLFYALTPLAMAAFAFALDGERLTPLAIVGLGIGLAGMVFLYSPSGAQGLPLVPTILGLFTSVAWGFGAVVGRRFASTNLVQTSAMQMLIASAILWAIAALGGERLAVAQFTPAAVFAVAYLVVFGSIVGFSAFLWLVNNVPTTLASTYSYVNPVVSIAIGVGLLHERFDLHLAAGAAIILAGVAAMVAGRAKRAA